MAASFPLLPGSPRLVGKQNTAGQTTLSVSVGGITSSYSAWIQATASSAVEYYVVGVAGTANTNDGAVPRAVLVDIGIGASGSEVAIGTAVYVGSSANNTYPSGCALLPVPLRVSAGSRISVRASVPAWSAGAVSISVYLMLVPYTSVEGN